MSFGDLDFKTWLARRERPGAVLPDGSTSVLAENDLLGSTVDPSEFSSWEAREAATERGRQSVLDTKKRSIFDGGYDTWRDVLMAPVERSIMPGGGIATSPNDPLAAQLIAGFFNDTLTPAGLATTALPGYGAARTVTRAVPNVAQRSRMLTPEFDLVTNALPKRAAVERVLRPGDNSMTAQLLRGMGRAGSAAYGAHGAEMAFTGDTTGERILGGVESLLGTLGTFAPNPHVDPVASPSSRAQGRISPWPPKPAGSGPDDPLLPGGSNGRALLTGDTIIDGEFDEIFNPPAAGAGRPALPPADPRGLYPAALPEQRPIRLGAIPTAIERPDLLSDEALYDEFTKAVLSNKFDDLAVFEAEVARRGPERGFAPSTAAVPDAGVSQPAASPSIFEDPQVVAALEALRKRADQISTRTMPQPIDVPIEQRTIRPRPAAAPSPAGPEFAPVGSEAPLETVPRETIATGDDIADAIFDPQELAYQTVLNKYRNGEQLTNSHMKVLDDMASVRDAKAARTGIMESGVNDVAGTSRNTASAGSDVRSVRPQSSSPAAGGVRPGGSDVDRAVGGGPRRIAPEDAPHFNQLLADARANGFRGSDAELEQLYLDNLDKARAYSDEMQALDLEDGPVAILRAIAEEGGVSLSAEMGGAAARAAGMTGNRAELRKLFEEMDYGTAPGGYSKRTGGVTATRRYPQGGLTGIGPIVNQLNDGKSLDIMAEALRARGFNVEGPNELLDQIEAALVAHRQTRVAPNVLKALEEGLGVRPGNRWWDPQGAAAVDEALDTVPPPAVARTAIDDAIEPSGDVDLSFDPKQFDPDSVIDEILGGAQPRLPGAGQVRNAEIATPEFEAPFALTSEADKTPDALDRALIDAPVAAADDADSLIDEALDVPTFEQLPGNVRSFLTKQLGYSPDEINAMTPDQAIAAGKARTPSPSRQQAAEARPTLTQGEVAVRDKVRAARQQAGEERRVAALNEFAETELPRREAQALERQGTVRARQEPRKVAVKGEEGERKATRIPAGQVPPGTLKGAVARGKAVRDEMAADRAEAERLRDLTERAKTDPVAKSELQSRAASMASEDRRISAQIKRLMDDPDPTPEKFDEMRALYEQQAEKFAKRQLKGGSGKEMSNEELYSFLSNNIGSMGPLAALNPKVFRQLVSSWYASPVIRSMFGGFAGASMDDESEFRGFVYGAAAAAATPSGLRALARAARLAKQGKAPWPVDPRDSGKDISWARLLLPFSPEGTVPDLFRNVTEQLTRLQQVYDSPAFDDNARAAIMKSAKPAIAQMMRTAAEAAKAKGLKRKAYYATKLADAYESKLTAGQRAVKNAGEAAGLKLKGNEIERHIGGNVYRVLVGYALDTAAQNLTQPIMTMLYVSPRSLMRAYKHSRTDAARAMMKRFDAELPEVPELADEDLFDVARRKPETTGVKKHSPMKLLHVTDNYNRRVALLAGLEEAGVLNDALSGKLDLLDPRAQRAMSIMRKTQGHFGAMGNNPLYRGPVMGSAKPFTKYPFMFVERMLDAFQDPDAKGLQYISVLLGAALAGRTIGLDLEDLLLGGGRPLGIDLTDPEETAGKILSGDAFPAGRAIKDAAAHATGSADHSMFEDLPNLAVGRYPMKVADKVKNHLAVHGTGDHKSASGTAPEHDGYDDILSLLGMQTTERGDKLKARDEAYEFNKFSNRERDEKMRSLREEYRKASERGDRAKMRALENQMTEGQRRSLRRSTQQTPYERLREQTPREKRDEFDRRFRDRLEDK